MRPDQCDGRLVGVAVDMTNPIPLSPAARAVINATAVEACLAEWGSVNDPPCHPDDEGWNGCHLCVKGDLIAAALRAAADQLRYACADEAADWLTGIAAELESSDNPSL